MNDLRAAAQQALEALGLWATGRDIDAVALNDLIFRLEAALAEPVQPVAWMYTHSNGDGTESRSVFIGRDFPTYYKPLLDPVPLYTAPPQRNPLDKDALIDEFCKTPDIHQFVSAFVAGARYAERAHGIWGDE